MKDICLDINGCGGLGDILSVTPVLRKLYKSYGRKISVVTQITDVFKNNPYVADLYSRDNFDRKLIDEKYEVLTSFVPGVKNQYGASLKHNTMDIRQFHAAGLGFGLAKSEMALDYIPDPYVPIENLPEKYVLIHPVQNWASRTWDPNKWKELTQLLNGQGIAVVAVGKNSSEVGNSNTQKPVFDFEIQNGLNLLNKTSISQTWWLIQKSECIITMDSGLLHLAGTTDTNIVQLGSSINPEFRVPYRFGTQDYKYTYVPGSCDLLCASDVKYGVKQWGTILTVPSLVGCLENKSSFECHPTVFNVFRNVIPLFKSNIAFK
jgi:hypothetical protein